LLSRESPHVRRARRAVLLCVFLAGATARSVHGQTGTSPDIVAEAGVAAGRSVSAARAGTPAARAAWFAGAAIISPPFRLGRNWDTSAVARVAREAVLGAARVDGGVAPAYFDAVRASLSLWFVHTSGAFDVAIVGRYAETRIDSSQPVAPAENDNGNWTFLVDATVHARWYARRDAAAPPAHRRLMPVIDVDAGIKHDRRLHRAGDLQPYDDPTGRVGAGVFVAVWRFRDSDGVPRVVVGGRAEFETALRAGIRLPSAARVLLRAYLDVRRLAATARTANTRDGRSRKSDATGKERLDE